MIINIHVHLNENNLSHQKHVTTSIVPALFNKHNLYATHLAISSKRPGVLVTYSILMTCEDLGATFPLLGMIAMGFSPEYLILNSPSFDPWL